MHSGAGIKSGPSSCSLFSSPMSEYPIITKILPSFGFHLAPNFDDPKSVLASLPFGDTLVERYLTENKFDELFQHRIKTVYDWTFKNSEETNHTQEDFEEELTRLLQKYKQTRGAPAENATNKPICSGCHQPNAGTRYKCVFCLDAELCEACEAKNPTEVLHDRDHLFIKIPTGKSFSWKAVWQYRVKNLPPQAATFVKTSSINSSSDA